jgi:predicted DNA-binding WGR domain protein
MDNLLTIEFEAHCDERNHHRRYEIVLGRDLLDEWTVSIRYGRTGRSGQEQRFGCPKAEEARMIIRDRLRRRLSARRRIGCPYRLTRLSAAPGFDSSAWLPGELVARFFQAG